MSEVGSFKSTALPRWWNEKQKIMTYKYGYMTALKGEAGCRHLRGQMRLETLDLKFRNWRGDGSGESRHFHTD